VKESGSADASKYMVASCCVCRRIRSDDGHFHEGEDLLSLAEPRGLVTHTFCLECLKTIYPEYADKIAAKLTSPVA